MLIVLCVGKDCTDSSSNNGHTEPVQPLVNANADVDSNKDNYVVGWW